MILVVLLLYSIPVTQGIITTIYDWKAVSYRIQALTVTDN
jgi:hypothetical protein